MFCHDFTAFFFLVFIGRTSDASVVLKHCVARYKDRNVKEEKQKFEDLTMFRVYNGLYTIYKRQDQVLLFLSLVKEMGEIAKKLENFAALIILATIYTNLEDTEKSKTFAILATENLTKLRGYGQNAMLDCSKSAFIGHHVIIC